MESKTYTTIDRAALGWPSGKWDREPDKLQWPDEATGLPCLAVRHPRWGFWCGYVGVEPEHPWHGRDYDDHAVDVEAHGGLTFASACSRPHDNEATGVCHVPSPGEPENVWWFGFDCGHFRDLSPQDGSDTSDGQSYKSLAYVQHECGKIASQLKAAEGGDKC